MDCCVPEAKEAARVPCPGCGQVGRPVGCATVEAILRPGRAESLAGPDPRICRTRECEVLYYGSDGASAPKQDAQVRVGLKETDDPVPVCYCFGFNRADIERELVETGGCTIPARITAEVKAGNCACEIKNPSGACCLGDVTREIKDAKLRLAPAMRTGT